MARFIKVLKNFDRIPEILRCINNVREFHTVIPAFLGLLKLKYPQTFHSKSGKKLKVYDFEDLTTLWAVWCADEYRIPDDARLVVDAGANIGAFSLFSLGNAPHARVIALEPFPATFDKLHWAIEANNAAMVVCCEQAALSDTRKTLFMDSDPGIKSHSRKAVDADCVGSTVAVQGLGLEDLLARYSLQSIDYLKVDIEGGEVSFFSGVSRDHLRKVKKIGVECHSREGQAVVWSAIRASGFELERISRGTENSGASTAEFVRS